mgnify:FL=1
MDISVNELMRFDNVNIIDIRDKYKYEMGHIPNSINIPYIILMNSYSRYLDRDNVYYIYCQAGVMSKKCCLLLNELGYKVINVTGGYDAYILNS